MTLFIGVSAIQSQANLLFAVFGILIGILLICWHVSWLVLKRLGLKRMMPESLTVGQAAGISYEFENQKRFWPTFSISLAELTDAQAFSRPPSTYLLHVAAGQRAQISTQIIPTRRGVHRLDQLELSTSFPFGFILRTLQRRLSDSVVAHPPIARVDPRFLSLCLSAEAHGAHFKPRRGGTDEFYGLKEYRQGENPRWINWKRSARTGTLVMREMSHVAPPRLMIFLDTHLPEQNRTLADFARVEKAIAIAASLICKTIDEGLAVGVHCFNGEPATIKPNRGKRHARDLLSMLAKLPFNGTFIQRKLLDTASHALHSNATGILISAETNGAAPDPPRGSAWVVIGADSPQATRWFQFEKQVDFASMVPLDQVPLIEEAKGGKDV